MSDHFNPLLHGTTYASFVSGTDFIHVNAEALLILEMGEQGGAFFALPWSEVKPMARAAYERLMEKEAAVVAALAQTKKAPKKRVKK